jgi:hypothetical protein
MFCEIPLHYDLGTFFHNNGEFFIDHLVLLPIINETVYSLISSDIYIELSDEDEYQHMG